MTETAGTFHHPDHGVRIHPRPPLIGRERDVEQVLALLDQDHLRVLTLTGPGGVGKTSLALEVRSRLADQFAHGSGFVALAPIRQPDLVPIAVIDALGLRESGSDDPFDLLPTWLRPRHFLLVLDNMEQVIDAAYPWLSDLMTVCPRLKVLVTSRIALDIAGEQRYRVPPLEVPASAATDHLDENASVALFLQRARELRSDFEPAEESLRDIAKICRKLDGLPLAIELAAARTNILSPAEILARLTDTFTVLASTRRDAPARLRSLHDAIAWSYDLLRADKQALFCRLALFGGGFTLEAAEAITARLPPDLVASPAASLVGVLADHSLIERYDDVSGTRFRMLETIREFGLAQLESRHELDAAHDAHAAYYADLARLARRGLLGIDQATWFDRLETEYVNLRDAMTWLTTSGRVADAVDFYRNIEMFLQLHAHYADCRMLMEGWAAVLDTDDRSRTRAQILDSLSSLAVSMEEDDLREDALLEALELFREIGDRQEVMETLGSLSFVSRISGNLERARAANHEHLALARESGDARATALALAGAAGIEEMGGDTAATRHAFDQALSAARVAGLPLMTAHLLSHLAEVELNANHDLTHARALAEESRTVLERIGDKRNLPFIYFRLARIHEAVGDVDCARAYLDQALAISRETGLTGHEVFSHLELGRIGVRSGNVQDAHSHLRRSMELYGESAFGAMLADCLTVFVELALGSGDAHAAAGFLGAAEGHLADVGYAELSGWSGDKIVELRERIASGGDRESMEQLMADARDWTRDQAIQAALAWQPPAAAAERSVASGHGLSPRELEVLRLMADGRTNQEIAADLFLSLRTVTTHITAILRKLNLPSRTAAVAFAIRNGIA